MSPSPVKYALRFIRYAAKNGFLEQTKSKHVGATYGVDVELVKRIKARFRTELMFGEGK